MVWRFRSAGGVLGVQGSGAWVEDGRLVVVKDEERLLDVPIGLVARIVCFGAVGVSAGLRNWALSAGIELVFCSHRGRYLGQTISGPAVRASRLRRQLHVAQDPARSLPPARAMVAAKLRKQFVLLRRTMRGESAEELGAAISAIESYVAMLPQATSRDELMGLEGAAARAYFQSWRAFLPGDLGFTGRNRRPPRDVVNAALSFGYALLVSETTSALVAAGMEPSVGLLHAEDGDRPSLVLDLAEEFRPLVVDQLVLEAFRRRRLTAEHGRRDTERDGVLLTKAGRQAVLDGYERRMLQTTKGALPDFSGSLRRHLYRQAQNIAGYVEGTVAELTGLSWR
ncbi:CRISPR-associated endonuclease Cas1 [Amycolatopsis sp. NPDC051758]|uniref:CRISPR-associated endonuclease Cas1 n=1 Tax=Amycolatopsis sp. NPDC051758 TaxID=3363935 RepID=UPI00379A53EC